MNTKISFKEILIAILSILIIIILFYLVKIYFITTSPQFEQDKQLFDNSIFKKTMDSKQIQDCDLINNKAKKQICKIKLKQCNEKKDSCLYNKALVNNLENDCFKIKNISLKIQCTTRIKYNNLMINPVIKNDINLCSNFKDINSKNACKDNFYYAKSVNMQNKTFCEKIQNEVIKNECQN